MENIDGLFTFIFQVVKTDIYLLKFPLCTNFGISLNNVLVRVRITAFPSHLNILLLVHVLDSGRNLKFPGSLLPDTLCLFEIRCACSKYAMPVRDTLCLVRV